MSLRCLSSSECIKTRLSSFPIITITIRLLSFFKERFLRACNVPALLTGHGSALIQVESIWFSVGHLCILWLCWVACRQSFLWSCCDEYLWIWLEHKSCVDFLDGVCAKNKDCSLSLDVSINFKFYMDQSYWAFSSSG